MRSSRLAKRCLPNPSAPCPCQYLHHRPRRQLHPPSQPSILLFSTSVPRTGRRQPKHKSISVEEYQKIIQEQSKKYLAYTEHDKKVLAQRYTPEQMAAVQAGEAAISVEDLITQGRIRADPLAFKYVSDFATIDPVVDKRISRLRGKGDDYLDTFAKAKMMDLEEPAEKWKKIVDLFLEPDADQPLDEFDTMWAEEMKIQSNTTGAIEMTDAEREEFLKEGEGEGEGEEEEREVITEYIEDMTSDFQPTSQPADPSVPLEPLVTDSDGTKYSAATLAKLEEIMADYGEAVDPPDVAPTLPRIEDPTVTWGDPDSVPEADNDSSISEETRAMYSLLSKQTGRSIDELRRFRVRVLVERRVVNQTRLGKIASTAYLTVAGNQNGLLGLGEAKSAEPEDARRASTIAALRNMRPILRYEDRTIFGAVKGKVGAVKLQLFSRPPGFGVRTQHLIFEMARLAGIHDLAGRVGKARNKMNVAKAAYQALLGQRDPEDLARARGKKFVDVRKVYYAGKV